MEARQKFETSVKKRSILRTKITMKNVPWITLLVGGASLGVGLFFWTQGNGAGESQSLQEAPAKTKQDGSPEPSENQQSASRGLTMGDRLAAEFARAKPAGDDWDTEKFHVAAKARLKKLAKYLAHPADLATSDLSPYLHEGCRAKTLRPASLPQVYDSSELQVYRARFEPKQGSKVREGMAGVTAVLAELAAPLAEMESTRSKFKIYRVTPGEGHVETMVFYHSYGRKGEKSVQQNATWRIWWTEPEGEEVPRVIGIFPEAYEEIAGSLEDGRALLDCTASLLGSSEAYQKQLLPGASYWARRLSQRLGGEPGGYKGLALGDVNGDGLDDVYITQTGGLPNRLFVQQPDGSLLDRSAEAGLDFLDLTRSALFVDLDNDGNQDLVLSMRRELLVMKNDGNGHFERVGLIRSAGAPYSLSAADFDQDGDLDLYVCNYGNVWAGLGEFDHHVPIPMQDAQNGSANMLLRNDGDFQFHEATGEVGLGENNNRWSLSAAWEDYDNDGDLDLYVANDFGRNNLYRNDEGDRPGERRFVDLAEALAAEDLSPGMSASWGDCNNDGKMDLYVSNMFSGAGNRITFQDRFMPEADASVKEQFQRHARGNSLLLNRGVDEAFEDVTAGAGVGVGRWAWSSTFADLNNDTLADILVANGYVTETETTDL